MGSWLTIQVWNIQSISLKIEYIDLWLVMNKILLLVNGLVAFDFDKEISLEESELGFLDKMDSDMDKGAKINGQLIAEPDIQQRATFVTMNLIRALQQNNQVVVKASCAFITNRLPDLAEVYVSDHDTGIIVEFM